MNSSKPYTYLIGWSCLNKWYYGVRYANQCSPSDLWKNYFTSSKIVKKFRKDHGEPDVVRIRQIFTNRDQAQIWEHKVLQRLRVVKSNKWLNETDNKSISYAQTLRGSKLGADKIRGKKQNTTHVNNKIKSLREYHSNNLEKLGSKRPGFSEIASRANITRLANNNHQFLDKEKQIEWTRKKVVNGTQGASTVEAKQKLRDKAKLKIIAGTHPTQEIWHCPHCGTTGKGAANKSRWHFDNCRNSAHSI